MNRLFNTLSTKLFFAITLWLIGALFFTGFSLHLIWRLEDSGIAINQAGSLRMKMAQNVLKTSLGENSNILAAEFLLFRKSLNQLRSITAANVADKKSFSQKIEQIDRRAERLFEHLIWQTRQHDYTISTATLQQMHLIINQLDDLVKTIENDNTRNIQWLRIFQFILVFMVIITALLNLLFLHRLVIKPLNRIKSGIDAMSQGDLTAYITPTTQDEFGAVAIGFNQMAQNIHDLYNNLEKRVQEQTQKLKKSNDELKILYDVTTLLHETYEIEGVIHGFLKSIQQITQAQAVTIQLTGKYGADNSYFIGFDAIRELQLTEQAFQNNASSHIYQPNIIIRRIIATDGFVTPFVESFSFHISNKHNTVNLVTYFTQNRQFTHNNQLAQSTIPLIEVLASHFAIAIENQRLATLDKQFAVLEERNLMAQGLHDSIAQSLSFLNIQAQMLKHAIRKNQMQKIEENIQFIQQGIQVSYSDVRELLTNFRTKLDTENFQQSIQSVIQRFKIQSDTPVTLEMSSSGEELSIEQQLQVIFILQEALSNVRKHAQANSVQVTIMKDKAFIISIRDNGIGFSVSEKMQQKSQQIGLNIMLERAKRISGTIHFDSTPSAGTCITLTIPLKYERNIGS